MVHLHQPRAPAGQTAAQLRARPARPGQRHGARRPALPEGGGGGCPAGQLLLRVVRQDPMVAAGGLMKLSEGGTLEERLSLEAQHAELLGALLFSFGSKQHLLADWGILQGRSPHSISFAALNPWLAWHLP